MTIIGCNICNKMGWCDLHMGRQSEEPTHTYEVTFTVQVSAPGEYQAEQHARAAFRDPIAPRSGVKVTVKKIR
jgi:hypothetical protein